MITTELIKILQDNETGAISLKPREISLTINGRYMPNPQITLSSTGDGICGAEIDLDINGEWLEQEPILDEIRAEIEDTLYVDSLIFGELIDFRNGKISADDVIEEFNRVTRLEVLKILDKYKSESDV